MSFRISIPRPLIGNRPNTVSESTVSNTELSEFFALTEFRGESSVSSSQPIICVPKRTHRVFPRTHQVCPQTHHRKIKGRFRKRVVLANVPSFRFSFPGNMRTYPRSGFRSGGTLVPVFVPGEHPPKPPFWKPPFWVPPNSVRLSEFSSPKQYSRNSIPPVS